MMVIRNPLSALLSVSLVASAVTVPNPAAAAVPIASATVRAAPDAQKPTAVLGLDGPDESASKNLTQELRAAFERRDFEGSEELSLAEVRLTMGCQGDEPPCLAEAGKSIGVEFLIYGILEPSGGGYTLKLNILDVNAAVTETATEQKLTKEQLKTGNIQETANQIVESLFPKEGEEDVLAPPPPVLEDDPDPYVEPRDEPSKSGLVWGPYKPRPKWKWAGFGVGVGLTVVGAAGAATTFAMLRGSLRDAVVDAAEESMNDCIDPQDPNRSVPCESDGDIRNEANDVDPNMDGDLCTAGRSETDALGNPISGGAVRNKDVADACTNADNVRTANIASFAVLGVGAVMTIVFTTLLFVHKENAATKAMRRRDIRIGAAPNPGGVTFSGGFRF